MKRSNLLLTCLVLAVASLVSVVTPVAAGKQAPFKGTLKGVVTRSGAPPVVSVNINGSGNATRLGHFTVSIPHSVNVVSRTATGEYIFVAANGDTLTATFTGASTPTADPDVLSIVENATITGGTGRFAGATGSFTTERLYDTVAGTTAGCFSGSISTRRAHHGHDNDRRDHDDDDDN
jgi:hypothetical protein